MPGTRVTVTDIETGESDSAVITDNYLVVTDGDRYVASSQVHANGTAIVTIKKREATR